MVCSFNMNIAGMSFAVSCLYSSTMRYCSEYLSEEPGAFLIEITQKDIDAERDFCAKEESGADPSLQNCSDAYLETIALLRKLSDFITNHDRMLMHGSAICVDGKAYIFTALSGTGKSTHTRLLRKLLGDRCFMINDDKPFLHFKDGKVYVCGNPWMGKHRIGTNTIKPLGGIFFLRRSEENVLKIMPSENAVPLTFSQVHRPSDPEHMMHTFDMLDKLLASVPLYDFGCNMDISAAELSSSVMK